MIEIYDTAPPGFVPRLQVSACYLSFDGKTLLLRRAAHKVEPDVWGVPAGKLEPGETPVEAAVRELWEETGITTPNLLYLGACYIRRPEIDFVYYRFKVALDHFPEVRLSSEHVEYKWATAEDIEVLPLVTGARELLRSL